MTSFLDDNGNSLDYDGDDFTITKQSFSVFSFNLKGDASTNFKISNSYVNRKSLGYYGPRQISSPAMTKIPFNVFRNGNKVARGYIVIQVVTDDQMECYFISGNAIWFADFQFDIRDVDLSDFTLTSWGATGIGADQTAPPSQGITFPFVDWAYSRKKFYSFMASIFYFDNGYSSGDPTNSGSDFYPCFYLKNMVDYVFRQANYKLAGDILTDTLYNHTLITPTNGDLQYPDSLIGASEVYASLKATQAVSGGMTTAIQLTLDKGDVNRWDNTLYRYLSYGLFVYVVDITISVDVSQAYTVNGVVLSTSTVLNYHSGTTGGLPKGTPYGATTISAAAGFNITSAKAHIRVLKTVRSLSFYVNPACIIPSLRAIELIKSVAIRFGCTVTFDDTSKVVTLNRLDNLTATEDWSNYLVSYKYLYQYGFKNNFLRTPQPEEFADYDLANKAGYGEGNFSSEYSVNIDRELYTDPFAGSLDTVMDNPLQWCQPYIPMVNFEDSDAFTITSITNSGVFAQLNGTGFSAELYTVIRVYSTNGLYSGYHQVQSVSSTTILLNSPYLGASVGYWYKQNVSFNSPGSRLLTVTTGYPLANFGARGAFDIDNYASPVDLYTTCNYAYFCKPTTGRIVDQLKESLSFSPINLPGYSDVTLENRYTRVRRMLSSPLVRCQMRIPESVFLSFNSDKRIEIKCDDFSGYLWVDRITNYKDSNTPVEVDLLFT